MKKAKKTKKTKPAQKTAKAKKPEETMDRKALKAVVSQLKEMGSDVKVFKSDTDDALQKKVNEALQKLPSPEIVKKLEAIVPDKLVNVLKRDCIGLFVDLSDVSCVRCTDNEACIREFIKNLKGDMSAFGKAMPDVKVEPPPEPKKTKKLKVVYDPDALVFVKNVKNPNKKGDDLHDTIQAILDEEPGTMSELREIVERDFDVDSDKDFVTWLEGLRFPDDPKEQVIKLVDDLTAENKKELRAAGYEV